MNFLQAIGNFFLGIGLIFDDHIDRARRSLIRAVVCLIAFMVIGLLIGRFVSEGAAELILAFNSVLSGFLLSIFAVRAGGIAYATALTNTAIVGTVRAASEPIPFEGTIDLPQVVSTDNAKKFTLAMLSGLATVQLISLYTAIVPAYHSITHCLVVFGIIFFLAFAAPSWGPTGKWIARLQKGAIVLSVIVLALHTVSFFYTGVGTGIHDAVAAPFIAAWNGFVAVKLAAESSYLLAVMFWAGLVLSVGGAIWFFVKRSGEAVAPLVIGLAFLSFVLYLGIRTAQAVEKGGIPTPSVMSSSSNTGKVLETTPVSNKQLVATQDFRQFAAASWNNYGPGMDGTDMPVQQLWMSQVGSITYMVSVDKVDIGQPVVLVTRMSSELRRTTSSNPILASDVQLSVNQQVIGVHRAMTDDNRGADASWSIPAGIIKPGVNELVFVVQQGGNRLANGICIYSPIQLWQ